MQSTDLKHFLHKNSHWIILFLLAVLPIVEIYLPQSLKIAELMRPIFIFAILGLGLNIVTGYTGLLNLGVAAFMAIGAYSYSILTCEIYPFQIGFWNGILLSILLGAFSGLILGLPTIRLRGDYLAIVTLGFGEIVQDILKNLEVITKGTQGINPLPAPRVPWIDFKGSSPILYMYSFQSDAALPWYYLLLLILTLLVICNLNLENSRIGRSWISIREDELASRSMGISPIKNKLLAFSLGAACASLAGALWASHLGSSGEPNNYDFQVSVIALCIVIVGGRGSVGGVLLGALLMVGFNSILLVKVSQILSDSGITGSDNVFLSPGNWKYMIFGLALILTMRFKPMGLLSQTQTKL